MTNANYNIIIGSLLTYLNDSNNIAKPWSPYAGSLFFGPNQDVTFRNKAPKGRVTPGTSFTDGKSFGRGARRIKHYNLYIDFFTPEGATCGSGFKNIELVNDYLQKIETAVYAGSYGPVAVEAVTDDEMPQRVDSREQNVWFGRKLVVLKERHCP